MNHSEVVDQKIAEKYVLGELSAELREQFEQHYFACAECAADLEALATLMRVGKAVSEEDAIRVEVRPGRAATKPGWFSWLRPAVAVPAIALLALVIVLQSAGFIPQIGKFGTNPAAAEVYVTSYRLQGQTRGVDSKILLKDHGAFGLDFDFTPTENFPSYKGTLLDPLGEPVLRFVISGDEANKELHLVVPSGTFRAGNYSLVFTGENAGQSKEVERLRFAVEVGS